MSPEANLVRFELFEDDVYGIVAVSGDVQIGWCRKIDGLWWLSDMDENIVGCSFEELRAAEIGSLAAFSNCIGASNPGH